MRGRHKLAVLLLEQGRLAEAEGLWWAVLGADLHFLPAHVGLGEISLKAGNPTTLMSVVEMLRGMGPDAQAEALNLEARWRFGQNDYTGAAALIETAMHEHPDAVSLRLTLSHVRLADGSPPEVLEEALRAVLERDPNTQARHNLQVLMRNTGRFNEGVMTSTGSAET